jgi:hypothetical protein
MVCSGMENGHGEHEELASLRMEKGNGLLGLG